MPSCTKEERKKKKKNLLFADLPESADVRGLQVSCTLPPPAFQSEILALIRLVRGGPGRDRSLSWDRLRPQGFQSLSALDPILNIIKFLDPILNRR